MSVIMRIISTVVFSVRIIFTGICRLFGTNNRVSWFLTAQTQTTIRIIVPDLRLLVIMLFTLRLLIVAFPRRKSGRLPGILAYPTGTNLPVHV